MLKKLSFCIHSRIARLTAGLASIAALLAVPTAADAVANWFGSWDYVLRHDADGQPMAAFARLRGEGGSLLWLTCQRQVLDSEEPPVSFITAAVAQKQYLGRSDSRGRSTVYWFDGGSPEVGHWIYRDRYGQIPEPEQVHAFIDRLARAQSLSVELSNYRYETRKLEFHLNAGDTRNVAERFRKDCGDILRETPLDP
ncbi:hypothetical protein KHP60_03630 [Microvirga sp. 3-52]|uniref:hypothetical protein n=1 Tax=Microvirga sp. 3-52 TaxID=2792425 RepID=UPI001ACD6E49|nr:hypothetical protein [Microvirga sp. 3-52]MBO1904391.1 hypothetical protein [Microvirga sp. 3-52]MBS7451439.1 hypothetical protein [Microvirga sp. 3-52]